MYPRTGMDGVPSLEYKPRLVDPVDVAVLGHDLLSAIHAGELVVMEGSTIPYASIPTREVATYTGLWDVIHTVKGGLCVPHYIGVIATEEEYELPTHRDNRSHGIVKGVMLIGSADLVEGEGNGTKVQTMTPGGVFTVHNERVPEEERVLHGVNPITVPRVTLLLSWADILL